MIVKTEPNELRTRDDAEAALENSAAGTRTEAPASTLGGAPAKAAKAAGASASVGVVERSTSVGATTKQHHRPSFRKTGTKDASWRGASATP